MNLSRPQIERIIRDVMREMETEAAAAAAAPQPLAEAQPLAQAGSSASLPIALAKATASASSSPDELARLQATTPARIGINRVGTRYLTPAYLDFLQAHAAARDAVLGEVPDDLVATLGLLAVTTRAATKDAYLTNPDLGRNLSEAAKETVRQQGTRNAKLQVIVVDGLSSTGMAVNLATLLQGIRQLAQRGGYGLGTPLFVRHGRLGVTNEIGELLAPEAALSLVGERPGLVTAESLGAYVTWRPMAGTTEADRNLVSNIHAGGTPVPQALDKIADLLKRVYDQKRSGVQLK
jgi:ethanolamine ammonia-lyase small subunit